MVVEECVEVEFFTLDINPEPIFPQIDCLDQAEAKKIQSENTLAFFPELNFRIQNGASITDVFSQADIISLGLIINETVYKILNSFRLINHQIIEVSIKDVDKNYFWFHLIASIDDIDWLDYSKSTFYRNEFGFREEYIILNSYEDYLLKNKEINDMSTISMEKIKLNERFQLYNYDLFILPFLSQSIFISKKLKERLEMANISGIKIRKSLIFS